MMGREEPREMNEFVNGTGFCSARIGIINVNVICVYEVFHVSKDKVFNSLWTIFTNKRDGVTKILKILWMLNIGFFFFDLIFSHIA